MQITVNEDRLAEITALEHGSHDASGHFCAMEAVAYVAGEPWSDHPQCACPVIGTFMRSWNDALPNDDERTRLLMPLIPRLVGTRSTKAIEDRRAMMAADWLVRTHTPAWLRLAGLTAQADAIASLPEITSMAQIPSIREPLEAVRRDAAAAGAAAGAAARAAARDAAWAAAWAAARAAARDAARDAAWDAAGAAAWDAAGAAAWDAAWDAAGAAAWDAAGAAAWDAAWDAAGAAARAAAGAKLALTKVELQQSALALIERMIAASSEKKAA